jgi:hypothetical protein
MPSPALTERKFLTRSTPGHSAVKHRDLQHATSFPVVAGAVTAARRLTVSPRYRSNVPNIGGRSASIDGLTAVKP